MLPHQKPKILKYSLLPGLHIVFNPSDDFVT